MKLKESKVSFVASLPTIVILFYPCLIIMVALIPLYKHLITFDTKCALTVALRQGQSLNSRKQTTKCLSEYGYNSTHHKQKKWHKISIHLSGRLRIMTSSLFIEKWYKEDFSSLKVISNVMWYLKLLFDLKWSLLNFNLLMILNVTSYLKWL